MRSPTFSRRTGRVKASAIREILKVTERPEILSFAGGLPAPEAFPVAELAAAHADVFARECSGVDGRFAQAEHVSLH